MASFPRAALLFLVLLVTILCCSATSLDVEEKQKEKEALESADKVVSRADGVPDPPQNLVVDPHSDTMIMLFWEDPADDTDLDHYFVYVEEKEGMDQTTAYNYCAFSNLEASTEYTFGVMSVSADGNMSDPVIGKGRTLEGDDGVPDPPQNLFVQPQTPTSIMLIWQDPDDDTDLDHYLVYVEGEDMRDTTKGNYYLVESLEPCTDYTFGVMSVSVEGNMSDPVLENGETGIGAPPAPQNLAVNGYSSTTVTLSWDEPDTLCDVEEYRVKWIKDGIDTYNERTNETSFTVTGLSINTTYTFTVAGITEYGTGEEASVQQTTKVFDGGPPENLVAVGISESEMNVSWTPPAYEPQYYVVTAPPCVFMGENVSGLSFPITGLFPCDSCLVSVTSYYSDIFHYSAETVGTSQGGEPPPPPSCSVEVVTGAITVEWQRPDSTCLLGIYSGHWTGTKLWGDEEEVSGSRNTSGTSFNVFEPVPYSRYTFEISSSINGVFGSPASCSGTSRETQPGSPVIGEVDSVQGEAVVTWETPAEENGLIVEYGIFVDGATVPQKNVSGNVHSTSLKLDPCETYSLSIKAKNGAGWGLPSEAKDVTIVGDVLPENVDCSASDFNVEVCWDPYDETCPMSHYNLMWEGDVLWSDEFVDANSTSLEWSTNRACQIIAALPYTTYYVELTVGTGTDNKNCSVTTSMAAPGPPADVSVTTQDLTILVEWTEPEEKNGIIDFYQVEWGSTDGGGSNLTEDNTTFSYDIRGMKCGWIVDVTVRAKVETVEELGERSSPQRVYLVNSVEELNCEPSGSGQVSLNWTLVYPACPISSYNVTWVYESLWSDDIGKGSLDAGKYETSFVVASLPPYSNVFLQIHVDNSPEYSECITVTSQDKSSPPTTLKQTANDSSSVTITWGLPQNISGELEGWYLRWTTLDDEPIGEDTVSEVQWTYTISELSKSSTYVVYVSAVNGAGNGEEGEINAHTAQVPTEKPENKKNSSNTGLIIGLSAAGGILLILLLVGSIILRRRRGSLKPPRSAPYMPEVADADSDELYKMQHLSSATQGLHDKHRSVDNATDRELYVSWPSFHIYETINEDGQMPDSPTGRQVSTSLPKEEAHNRSSEQANVKLKFFDEDNSRRSQQDLPGRPSFSGGRDKPSLRESGRRPSQQIDVGRPNLRESGRRPLQQIDVGRPNLRESGRRPSQHIDVGRPNLREYGRRPSQLVDLGQADRSLKVGSSPPSTQAGMLRVHAQRKQITSALVPGAYLPRLPESRAPRRELRKPEWTGP